MLPSAILLSLAAAVVATHVDPRMPVITPAAVVKQRDIIPTLDPNQAESDVNSVFSDANSVVSDANSVVSDANSVVSGVGSVVTSAVSDANSLVSSAGSLITSVLSQTTDTATGLTLATPTPTHNEGPRQTGMIAAAAAIAGVAGAVILL